MRKKDEQRPPRIEEPEFFHKTCNDCCIGHYDTKFDNLSLDGSPTLIECKYQEWRVLINNRACEYFKNKRQ